MFFALLDFLTDGLTEVSGTQRDQVKLIICLLASYPIGFLYRKLKSPLIRHIVGIVLGLYLEFYLYGTQVLFLCLFALSAYLLIFVVGRKCGFILTVYCLTFLAIFHIYRMYIDYGGWNMDITTTLMMTVPRICSLAWCYQDGRTKEKLSPEQEIRKLEELPNLFQYFSYILFYSTVILGPFCDYNDFRDFIYLQNDYREIPNTFSASFLELLGGFVFMGITATVLPHYLPDYMATPQFAKDSVLYQIFYINFCMLVVRIRYYSAWYVGTANTMSCGLSYNGRDANGKPQWDRIWSASFRHEIRDNLREKLEDWNHSCQEWLRRYVYLRICSEEEGRKHPKKAVFAANGAFLVSACWHGFYPGYYLGFIHLFLHQANSKFVYRASHKFEFIPKGPIRVFLKHFLTLIFLNHAGVIFNLLTLTPTLAYLHAVHYVPSIIQIAVFAFFSITGWEQSSKTKKPSKKVETVTPGESFKENLVTKSE